MEFIFTAMEWLQDYPEFSRPAYVLLVTVVMAVGIPGGLFLLPTSGLLFGWIEGTAMAVLGLTLAAMSTHLFISTAFGRWLEERAAKSSWLGHPELLGDKTLLLILPRLVPVVPFFGLNVALSLVGVPRWAFFWTTLVGVIPVSMLFARVGSQFNDMQDLRNLELLPLLVSPGVLVPLAILALMTLSGWAVYHRYHRA